MKNLNKMKIAPDMQYEIGQDKVGYFPEWSVKDDRTLYEKVRKLAHSTFDLSKFTVVGSPNITDDGIASGFSTSNYIQIEDYFANKSTFKGTLIITTPDPSTQTGTGFTGIFASKTVRGFEMVYKQNENNIDIYISSDGTTWDIANTRQLINLLPNKTYKINFEKTLTDYYFEAIDVETGNTVDTLTINDSRNITATTGITFIGVARDLIATENYKGSIDLKQFSITVDGVEVFSGNKTGIDTIKPDNYTVVGTPTISADGIASGFVIDPSVTYDTSMTCVKSSITLGELIDKDWMIDISFQYVKNTVNTARRQVILSAGDASMWVSMCGVYIDTSNKVQVGLTPVGYTDNYVLNISASNIAQYFNSGDIMRVKMSYIHGTGTYKADILKGDDVKFSNTFIAEGENTNISKFVSNPEDHFNIGSGLQNNNGKYHGALGSIDLNAFKIYVDGNLVYQPCLKIPYTEGQNYVKVVDKLYRDRVKDLFEQKGYNGYYTIGEDDFTLPSNKWSDVIEHKENGLTVAEQRVDQTLTIRGACEQGVDVNLPMEFFSADSYAVFGVGTTGTNTASKFTPAADGNYIAIGKGKV